MHSIEVINDVERVGEPSQSGLLCDILWADPVDNAEGELMVKGPFEENETRGCSYVFGVEATSAILQQNALLSVIRAHEAQLDGYKMHRWKGNENFPPVITIFSAPNYCDVYGNKGAVV